MRKMEPAFPYAFEFDESSGFAPGLSKREYIASRIIPIVLEKFIHAEKQSIAKYTVEMTDLLLEELNK